MNNQKERNLYTINNYTMGEKIRYLREQQKLSLEKLAKEIGVAKGTLSEIENDNRLGNLSTIIDIANHFDVSIDWLCSRSKVRDTDYDLNFVCEYTGLNKEAIHNITVKDSIPIPMPLVNRVFPKNMAQYITGFDNSYFDIYESALNSLLSSDNLVNIITCCCLDNILFIALDELQDYYQKAKSNDVLTPENKERISFLIHFTRNYYLQHRLSQYIAADSINEFMKNKSKITKNKLSTIDEAIQYFETEIDSWKEGELHGNDQETQ